MFLRPRLAHTGSSNQLHISGVTLQVLQQTRLRYNLHRNSGESLSHQPESCHSKSAIFPEALVSAEKRIVSEYVEPLGLRILIRKDESRQETRGGIVLPDTSEIPTITGRVVEISVQIDRDEDFPIRKYDKVLFHPKNAIPVDFEADNLLYVVPVEDVVAIFRRPVRAVGEDRSLESLSDPDETE